MSIRWHIQRRSPFGQEGNRQAYERLQQQQQADLARYRSDQECARTEGGWERGSDAFRCAPEAAAETGVQAELEAGS